MYNVNSLIHATPKGILVPNSDTVNNYTDNVFKTTSLIQNFTQHSCVFVITTEYNFTALKIVNNKTKIVEAL